MSIRIGGLASGMDTDTMVADLMKAQRIPLDKLKQKKQVLEWQRDDYRSMNTLLLNFRSTLTNMALSTTYRSRATTSTDESKISATASSAASLTSYTINKVDKLATAATKVNTGAISASATSKVDMNKSLSELGSQLGTSITWDIEKGVAESQTITTSAAGTSFDLVLGNGVTVKNTKLDSLNVKVNGVSYQVVTGFSGDTSKKEVTIGSDGKLTFNQEIAKDSSIKVDYIASNRLQEVQISSDTDNITLSSDANHLSSTPTSIKVTTGETSVTYDIVGNTINDSGGNAIGTIDRTTGKVTITDSTKTFNSGDKVELSYVQDYSTFSVETRGPNNEIRKENFNISGTESLNSVITKVNSANVGVTMFYDVNSDRMTLTRKETGNFNTAGDEIITSGQLINDVLKFGTATETGGTNAKFTINGLDTERTSNTFEVSGVTFTLKKEFTDSAASISINNNSTQIFDNIKGFVTKYNELIEKIQAELKEDRYKSYTPLTDTQRESLTDKQQEQWEEKAKSGMLRRDPTLSSLLTKMRSNFSSPISNTGINPLYKQLASIGITTTANYLEGGKLEIDEAKLKKAIEADPTSIEKLFNATGTTDGEKGIIHRLTTTVNDTMSKLRTKAGNSFSTNNQFEIGKLMNDVDKKIERFEDRLTKVEDRYWAQFTAMEKAIQRSNEQMAQLMNFSGSSY
ncbi:flagellar filament capping protein FliD [Robertmurraya sp. P23]|uniref:flagellar filament capping protein FliD n=1 Tax=Robertmurraya sp. P23 TaxID=3436931 RepID=UPI003D990441